MGLAAIRDLRVIQEPVDIRLIVGTADIQEPVEYLGTAEYLGPAEYQGQVEYPGPADIQGIMEPADIQEPVVQAAIPDLRAIRAPAVQAAIRDLQAIQAPVGLAAIRDLQAIREPVDIRLIVGPAGIQEAAVIQGTAEYLGPADIPAPAATVVQAAILELQEQAAFPVQMEPLLLVVIQGNPVRAGFQAKAL